MMTQFDRSLRLGYGFSIVILLVISLISYFTLHNLLQSNRAVAHSSQVMQKLEKVLSVMKDAETGQRGYLLSGREAYLQPYNGAYREALLLTSQLAVMTADNQKQTNNILAIRHILSQRLDILQLLVEKKQRGEIIAPGDLDAGKAAMDALRKAVTDTEAQEQILLNQRATKLDRYTATLPGFIILAALLALGIAFYSYRNVVRYYRKKERLRMDLEASEEETQALNEELTAANEELRATNEELVDAREELSVNNDSLEQKVTERTKELQDSEEETQALNEELTAINEELAAINDELRHADERSTKLVAIVESSDDAIIGKDLNGVVTSWNRGAQQIFGYTESEMIGQPILKLIPEDRQHEEPFILSRLRRGEKIDHYETIRQTQDGRLIHVSLTISPIRDKDGRITGVSKIARDITEQKQDEQRKNDFIGMASHELKTPLTSLTALVQMLEIKLKDSIDPFVPQALSKANLQTRKMTSLINGFLNISRLESGKLDIRKNDFDLAVLINEQLEEIRLIVNSHTFHFEVEHPLPVTADREKIGSVISNLLSNAVKYSPRGKWIGVASRIEGSEVIVSVKDEGMGIRQQDLPRIFDRYYRAGSEHTQNISGFGVGLYLSAEIIHRHEGRIWVESEKGVGSSFYFSLPL